MPKASTKHNNNFNARQTLEIDGETFVFYSLPSAAKAGLSDIERLPYSLKIILENLLRHENGTSVTAESIRTLAQWSVQRGQAEQELVFHPARVLMQDFTGVPAIVDLASMRDAVKARGGDLKRINPQIPVDLIVDHSVVVDHFGHRDSLVKNIDMEYVRNLERYTFLKWGQSTFENFSVVPPGTGICHQINLEYLAKTVWVDRTKEQACVYPDTLVGLDSHTTMVNALAVLGWGVGGIEAEAAMLGQPISMLIPEVVGFHLYGELPQGVNGTDIVLTITEILRNKGVVGKFVEFFGNGLDAIRVSDRATIANMAPEYGATCGFFPIDSKTIDYLRLTNRTPSQLKLVETYAKLQGMWRDSNSVQPLFTSIVELDLSTVSPSIAGPKRPQDRIALTEAKPSFLRYLHKEYELASPRTFPIEGKPYTIQDGAIIIAAITSCTNTSNPEVMVSAGLLAKKAIERGLQTQPWVKTSLAPGSKVVTSYLQQAQLLPYLEALRFNLVGYGCTTCIGNSGPVDPALAKLVETQGLVSTAILSGNRNFEGRINPHVRANYLASPPLVVAYALVGNMMINFDQDPLGYDSKRGEPVYLKDLWPTQNEIDSIINAHLTPELYTEHYTKVFEGDPSWQAIHVHEEPTYSWQPKSTYVRHPPYFTQPKGSTTSVNDIENARILCMFGDSITTDHISPAGVIPKLSPAGLYLSENGVAEADYNQYGTRRGNHEVMMRGTFANIRIKNLMLVDAEDQCEEGGITRHYPTNEILSIYDAAMRYKDENVPLLVFAGKEYGTGSSRDWAAKGPMLLGVKAVIAESFERIHRSNLVGMGILPLTFTENTSWKSLGLTGSETISIRGIRQMREPRQQLIMEIFSDKDKPRQIPLLSRIDTQDEFRYFESSGILHYVLNQIA